MYFVNRREVVVFQLAELEEAGSVSNLFPQLISRRNATKNIRDMRGVEKELHSLFAGFGRVVCEQVDDHVAYGCLQQHRHGSAARIEASLRGL